MGMNHIDLLPIKVATQVSKGAEAEPLPLFQSHDLDIRLPQALGQRPAPAKANHTDGVALPLKAACQVRNHSLRPADFETVY